MKAVVVVHSKPGLPDAHAREVMHLLDEQGIRPREVRCAQLYRVEGTLSQAALKRLADEVLTDPVLQVSHVELEGAPPKARKGKADPGARVDIYMKEAITDPVAPSVLRAARHLELEFAVRVGQRVEIIGELTPEQAERAAWATLANTNVHTCQVSALG